MNNSNLVLPHMQPQAVTMAVMGLTLRDWIAVMTAPVVAEFLAAPGVELGDVAEGAYEFADLMLKAREKVR
jgi:hypothetical protein